MIEQTLHFYDGGYAKVEIDPIGIIGVTIYAAHGKHEKDVEPSDWYEIDFDDIVTALMDGRIR